jgi:hypothetical protein
MRIIPPLVLVFLWILLAPFLAAQSKQAHTKIIKLCDVPELKPLLEVPSSECLRQTAITPYMTLLDDLRHEPSERKKASDKPLIVAHSSTPSFLVPTYYADYNQFVIKDPFFYAVERAFADHRPLVISPDMIWLVIEQGVANHFELNAEALRDKAVNFQCKKTLTVSAYAYKDILFDTTQNTIVWQTLIGKFGEEIKANTQQNLYDNLVQQFSTTTPTHTTAFQVTLVKSTSHYFAYWMPSSCGIPQIILEGTPDDWKKLREAAKKLSYYDLDWWTDDLDFILAQFENAANGNVDEDFWESIYFLPKDIICGGQERVTGWITKLYPYIYEYGAYEKNTMVDDDFVAVFKNESMRKLITKIPIKCTENPEDKVNELKKKYPNNFVHLEESNYGVNPSCFTFNAAKTDFILDDNGALSKLQLWAGFLGVEQNPETMALRPLIGWAVINPLEQPSPEEIEDLENGLH